MSVSSVTGRCEGEGDPLSRWGGATSTDVARRAGVSRATVSYILNDDPSQSFTEATRTKVRAAAADLGYVPNEAARALRIGRTSTVLLPLPGVHLSPLWAGIVEHSARALSEGGRTLVADFTRYETPDALVEAGLRIQPAVVIDTFVVDRDAIALFEAGGVTVLSSRAAMEAAGPATPARRARTLQVEHLLERGCRRIVSIDLADGTDDPRQAPAVYSSLRERCAGAGASFETHTLDVADPGPMRALIADLADRPSRSRVDGVCAVNDHVAASALTTCLARGLRVPDDIAVIGLDDHPLGALLTPSLTTVAWDLEAFGANLAKGVEAALAGRTASLGVEALEYRVVGRESA